MVIMALLAIYTYILRCIQWILGIRQQDMENNGGVVELPPAPLPSNEGSQARPTMASTGEIEELPALITEEAPPNNAQPQNDGSQAFIINDITDREKVFIRRCQIVAQILVIIIFLLALNVTLDKVYLDIHLGINNVGILNKYANITISDNIVNIETNITLGVSFVQKGKGKTASPEGVTFNLTTLVRKNDPSAFFGSSFRISRNELPLTVKFKYQYSIPKTKRNFFNENSLTKNLP